jgi:predicted DNA-binding protein (UPF0251 family)
MPENECIDCGNPATGLRCKACHGKAEQRQAAERAAVRDAEVLRMVDEEKLSVARLAARLGVSRPSAYAAIRNARRRQAMLAE